MNATRISAANADRSWKAGRSDGMLEQRTNDERTASLEGLIRIGEVTSVNPEKLTARVTFDDDDGMTSFDLPILQRNTMKNRDYASVDIGEDVVCVFLPSGVEEGFIIGTLYAGEITPPQSSQNVRMVEFEDGTVLKYDRSAHKLSASVVGDVEVTASGKADITATGSVSVTSSKKIVLTAPSIVLNGAIEGYSQSGGSGTMKMTGTMSITGNVVSDGDVKASGISLKNHTHQCPDGQTSVPA